MSLYNIEIFDSNYDFISSTQISEDTFKFDYLALEPTVINTELITCSKGNWLSICDEEGKDKKWGYISAVDAGESSQDISIYPIMEKLDVTTYLDRTQLDDMSLEKFISLLILNTYVNNADEKQNILGLTVNALSATTGATLNLKDNTHNIYDIAIRSMKKYNIFIDFSISITDKKMVCNVRKASSTIRTIEADLENIIEPSFVFKDTQDMANKAVIYGVYGEDSANYGTTMSTTYYLDQNGNILKQPSTRITPVVWKTIEFKIQEDFESEAFEEAYDALYREELDNCIQISVSEDDSILKISDYEIGQVTKIIHNQKEYTSVFTGYEIKDGIVTFIFGAIRTEYTKQIRMERVAND